MFAFPLPVSLLVLTLFIGDEAAPDCQVSRRLLLDTCRGLFILMNFFLELPEI